jgi:RNA polymerase sigma-70 factor (ECF subfamily)
MTRTEPASEFLAAVEEAWIARAKLGEREAQQWLLTRYRSRVVRLATHILRRPDEAEDVAQEALVRALTQIKTYRGEASFSTWLLRIATRVCIDHTRRRTRRKEVAFEDTFSETHATTPGPVLDARLLVSSLLDELTPPLRAALVLRELEELSYEEIAAMLEIPVGTVRSRLSAARTRFRQLYEAVQEESNHV